MKKEYDEKLKEKDKEIEEKDEKIEEKDKEIEEKDEKIEEKDKNIKRIIKYFNKEQGKSPEEINKITKIPLKAIMSILTNMG